MIRPAAVLMFQGTGSGVGKSLLTAAFCRLASRRGLSVAPFKAQNMSNNAAVTRSGGEIGRAQDLQARAAGVEPEEAMNPVLLKPMADTRSEVVVLGRGHREATGRPWRARRDILWPIVRESIDDLRTRFDLIIAEGAGSPAETNLRESDIVNMSVARYADAAVVLVADIDRGGAFASLLGTWLLLDAEDRNRLCGFVLNRFRGDASLLAPAPADLERRTGLPVHGVVPWIDHLLPEEDGGPELRTEVGLPTIGVVQLPRAANVDDVDPLRAERGVSLRPVRGPTELAGLAALVIPGSRNTLEDLRWMRSRGLADAVRGWALDGLPVVGLCAGYQMMGQRVADPDHVEGGGDEAGLGLLPIETVLAPEKRASRSEATVEASGSIFDSLAGRRLLGYEIHHGRTIECDGASPWLVREGGPLGHASGTAWGCYLHGILENDALRAAWLATLGMRTDITWTGLLDREIDKIADEVGRAIDVDKVLGLAWHR